MLLLHVTILTLSRFALGSSEVIEEELCYGGNLRIPFERTGFQQQLYFTPSKKGGSRKLVIDNREVKDPRFEASYTSVTLRDLTERDEGTFAVSFGDSRLYDIVKLKVLECAKQLAMDYKDTLSRSVSRLADYLEFTPIFSLDPPSILWNRTDPQTFMGGRGHVRRNTWVIVRLIQADSGFYNFRKKDKTLQSRIKLTVTEHTSYHVTEVNELLHIRYPWNYTPWNITFTPKEDKTSTIMLMKSGYLVAENTWISEPFDFVGRLMEVDNGLRINPVRSTDSGVFEFRDQDGGLALVATVNVKNEFGPTYAYVIIIVSIILLVIVCCCCVKKCCSLAVGSTKRQSAPQTAATPAVYYHGTTQPEGPSYSAAPTTAPASSYQSFPVGTQEPTTSLGPPAYNSVDIHVNSTQPEVAVPGGQEAAQALTVGFDCLSSDSGPQFELKGVKFPSAPLFTSDSAYCDVYTSDKLNFL